MTTRIISVLFAISAFVLCAISARLILFDPCIDDATSLSLAIASIISFVSGVLHTDIAISRKLNT